MSRNKSGRRKRIYVGGAGGGGSRGVGRTVGRNRRMKGIEEQEKGEHEGGI